METILCFSNSIFSGNLLESKRLGPMYLPSNALPRHSKRFNPKNMATVSDKESCTSVKTLIKPSPSVELFKTGKIVDLTPWELGQLPYNYIQIGFLYPKLLTDDAIARLKSSLSLALYHFHTLNGRFITERKDDGICISLDPNGGDGVEFIHERAYKHISIDDLNKDEVPPILYSFFPLNGATNYDGHFLPLLSLQVTELADGFFLACTFNHSVGDGVSCYHFLKSWARICRKELSDQDQISSILVPGYPILDRWFVDKENTKIKLPYKDADEFIERCKPSNEHKLREKFFQFSSESISKLRSKANNECGTSNGKISSFQALFSLVWESVTRARGWYPEQVVTARIAANDRRRVRPPLPNEYFGCAVIYVYAETTAGELLDDDWIGAKLLNKSTLGRTTGVIRRALREWNETPRIFNPSGCGSSGISVGASTTFDVYGMDFGWGKPMIVRSGMANKYYDGNASVYAGREGIGSVELELILPEETMGKLEADQEFMDLVSVELNKDFGFCN